MTLILTNDDGIDAPGLQALQQAITGTSIIVAPKNHLSGCGHQVTTHQPIHLERRTANAYAVDGTPADCTRLALNYIAPQAKWIISGINAGGNLGVDAYISGTVAAAREAAMQNISSIAISHWIRQPLKIDWEVATNWAGKVLQQLWERRLPPKHFWNVNLPHLEPNSPEPPIVFCRPSTCPLPIKYRVEGDLLYYEGEYSKRNRVAGTDVDICFSGKIAVTLMQV